MCLEGQDYRLDDSEVPSATTARTPVPDMCCMVYDSTSWQMSLSFPMFALIFVSLGVNTPWMTPFTSKNADAVFFFFRKWQTLDILLWEKLSAFAAFGLVLCEERNGALTSPGPSLYIFRSSSNFLFFRQTSWYLSCPLFVISQFVVDNVVHSSGGQLRRCVYFELWPVYFSKIKCFHSCCVHMFWAGRCDRHHEWPSDHPRTLCNIFWHAESSLHRTCIPIRIGLGFGGEGGGGKFRPQKTKLIYEICHCRTTPPCIAPNWYLLHPLHFTSTWTVTPYQQMDCLINKPATFCTTLLSERTSQICLTLRLLMSYIYGAPILDVSRSHTTTQHSR